MTPASVVEQFPGIQIALADTRSHVAAALVAIAAAVLMRGNARVRSLAGLQSLAVSVGSALRTTDWSPDGVRLAYHWISLYFRLGVVGHLVSSSDGSRLFDERSRRYDLIPSWSPDDAHCLLLRPRRAWASTCCGDWRKRERAPFALIYRDCGPWSSYGAKSYCGNQKNENA